MNAVQVELLKDAVSLIDSGMNQLAKAAIQEAMEAGTVRVVLCHDRVERLEARLAAMCGWFDLMAEKIGWTAENAGSAFDAYHASRSILQEPAPEGVLNEQRPDDRFERSVNEALNMGDGSYKP